jgi:hypothetical protein
MKRKDTDKGGGRKYYLRKEKGKGGRKYYKSTGKVPAKGVNGNMGSK